MDFIDFLLRVLGGFYVFAGVVASRAATMSSLLDRAISVIELKPPPLEEALRGHWLLFTSLLVFAGGLLLVLLLEAAVWVFVAGTALQALYIYVLAPSYFDIADAPDARGRQQTRNAFVIYAAATALVAWAGYAGRLQSWDALPGPLLALVSAGAAAFVGTAVWSYVRAGRAGR